MAHKDETLIVLQPSMATIDVVLVADKHRWRHLQQILPAERRLYEEIYEVPTTGTTVRIIDDHFVQITFIALQGNGRDEIEQILRQELKTLDDAAIEALIKSEKPNNRATGLRILAAIAPDSVDFQTVKIFAEAANDPSPEVFEALIDAISRTSWSELWPVIDELAKSGKPQAEDLKKAAETYLPHLPESL